MGRGSNFADFSMSLKPLRKSLRERETVFPMPYC
jgi:hypothetical protein